MLRISRGFRLSTRRLFSVSPSISFDETVKVNIILEKNIQIDPFNSPSEHFFDKSIKITCVSENKISDDPLKTNFKAFMSDRYINQHILTCACFSKVFLHVCVNNICPHIYMYMYMYLSMYVYEYAYTFMCMNI